MQSSAINNGYVPFDTQTALLPNKSDAGQNRAVIKESEASVETGLTHPSDGIVNLPPGRDQFANTHVRVCRREEKSINALALSLFGLDSLRSVVDRNFHLITVEQGVLSHPHAATARLHSIPGCRLQVHSA